MNFRKHVGEDPEINLIPLIDVLLVILIFLMITTTYSKYAELRINLPSADAEKQHERPNEISVVITTVGDYIINKQPVASKEVSQLADDLRKAGAGLKDPIVIINGDRGSSLQATVTVMQAARIAGYPQVSISTQTSNPP
jgi:biopolymer transport protein ExbD